MRASSGEAHLILISSEVLENWLDDTKSYDVPFV